MTSQTTSAYNSCYMNSILDNKTFYTVNFKDTTYAYVTKDTLLDIIKTRKPEIECIVKFNYENELDMHTEILLFADHMKVFGNEYIKTYENLKEMYGSSPLDEFDKKIIFVMNGVNE